MRRVRPAEAAVALIGMGVGEGRKLCSCPSSGRRQGTSTLAARRRASGILVFSLFSVVNTCVEGWPWAHDGCSSVCLGAPSG